MFHRIRTYEPILAADGETFIPKVYGEPSYAGTWNGWLIFFPTPMSRAIATDRQTTQPDLSALVDWADTLTLADLHVALERARTLSRTTMLEDEIARLEQIERQALVDADALEAAADTERIAAIVDEESAEAARATAERLRRERLKDEEKIAAVDEIYASGSAVAHEKAAKEARAVAADARRRRRKTAPAAATTRVKPR